MHIAYWIVAGLLAAVYAFGGAKKLVQSQQQLAPMMGWVDTVPMRQVRLIGLVEVLGALGLILPPLTGVAPGLAVAAAIGLAVVQIGAFRLHLFRATSSVTCRSMSACSRWRSPPPGSVRSSGPDRPRRQHDLASGVAQLAAPGSTKAQVGTWAFVCPS